MIPNRAQAWEILQKYVKSESQQKHAMAVEAAMRYFARLNGEDEELWGVTGLLHDVDYELYPEQHCVKARELLEAEGVDEQIIHAVQSHGYELCCDVEPLTPMEKTLFAVDELTGLITAAAIMRPSRSVLDMELKSVKKKFKDKHFAAGCDREVIRRGAERMGIELDTLIWNTVLGMREAAEALRNESGSFSGIAARRYPGGTFGL